jgi:hypothetical protein
MLAVSSLALGLAAVPPAGPALPDSRPLEIVLGNGLRVDVVPTPGTSIFALYGRIDAGPLYDPPERPGLSAVAAEWLAWPLIGEDALGPAIRWTRPAEPRSAISPRWLAFSASGMLGQEGVLLEVLGGRLSSAVRAAEDGVAADRWERFRAAAASRARAASSTVEGQLWSHALAALYPRGSSLASPSWGPGEGVSGSPADLRGFLRAHVAAVRTHVVLAGAFEAAGLRPLLERTLGRVPAVGGSSPVPAVAASTGGESWRVVRLPRSDLGRDQVLVVCPVDRSRAVDDLAARALVFVLEGADGSGRLAKALVEPGLALTVDAGLAGDGKGGFLFVRTATDAAHTAELLDRTRAVFDDLARGRILEAEREAFLARERAEQGSGDPARCADRRLLGQPGCGEPPPILGLEELAAFARRLYDHGAPVALVAGPSRGAQERPVDAPGGVAPAEELTAAACSGGSSCACGSSNSGGGTLRRNPGIIVLTTA